MTEYKKQIKMCKDTTYLGYVNIKNKTIFTVGKFAILWNVFEEYNCRCNCNYTTIQNVVKNLYSTRKESFIRFSLQLRNRAELTGLSIEDYVKTKLFPSDSRARVSERKKCWDCRSIKLY